MKKLPTKHAKSAKKQASATCDYIAVELGWLETEAKPRVIYLSTAGKAELFRK